MMDLNLDVQAELTRQNVALKSIRHALVGATSTIFVLNSRIQERNVAGRTVEHAGSRGQQNAYRSKTRGFANAVPSFPPLRRVSTSTLHRR